MSDTNTLAVSDTKIEECEGMEKNMEMAEAEAWIPSHGSERLQLALATGELARALAVYRDERLEHERPGFLFAAYDQETRERINATLDNLRALAAERALGHGGARLEQFAKMCRLCGAVGRCRRLCDREREWTTCLADKWNDRPIYRPIYRPV